MDDVEKRKVLRTAREEMGIAVMKEGVDSLIFATRTVIFSLHFFERYKISGPSTKPPGKAISSLEDVGNNLDLFSAIGCKFLYFLKILDF